MNISFLKTYDKTLKQKNKLLVKFLRTLDLSQSGGISDYHSSKTYTYRTLGL